MNPSPPPPSQTVSSGVAGPAVHTTAPHSMPAGAQRGSAAGANYREQLEAQPPHSDRAASAGDGDDVHERHSISPAASATQGPTAAPQHEQGVPRTVGAVFRTPPALGGASSPSAPGLQRSESAPGSALGPVQAQPSPVLQSTQGRDEGTPVADAALSLSNSQLSPDAVVAETATASDEALLSNTAGPPPATMAAAMDAEIDEQDAPTDDAVDDDLPELPEGYSYLGRRMVRAADELGFRGTFRGRIDNKVGG